MKLRKPRIGLALGGGAARGWAHIGVIRALAERGIRPDLIAGTSVGSIVGGALATERLDEFENWVRGLRRLDVVRLLDARLTGGGFLRGSVLMKALEGVMGNPDIEDLAVPFGCITTELGTGRELWLRDGPLLDACRASIALPGLFAPAALDGRYLLDGGLVNPVPVSLARSLGADIVIAVNLNDEMVGHRFWHPVTPEPDIPSKPEDTPKAPEPDSEEARLAAEALALEQVGWGSKLTNGMKERLGAYLSSITRKDPMNPGLFEVIVGSIDIMQDHITRSRMVGEPPDIHIAPRVKHIALMDFDRADECIAAGELAVTRREAELDLLRDLLKKGTYRD